MTQSDQSVLWFFGDWKFAVKMRYPGVALVKSWYAFRLRRLSSSVCVCVSWRSGLNLGRGIFPVNFRLKWLFWCLLWNLEMHFDCAGLHQSCGAVLWPVSSCSSSSSVSSSSSSSSPSSSSPSPSPSPPPSPSPSSSTCSYIILPLPHTVWGLLPGYLGKRWHSTIAWNEVQRLDFCWNRLLAGIYSPSAGEESESLRSRVPQILIFKYRQIYTTTGRGPLKFLRHS